MKNNKQNNNKNINISINIDENININMNRNKNIHKNIEKNAVLSKLSLNPKSIEGVINIINDNNFPSSDSLYNELLKFNLYEILSIKANLEKADKVNFLVDQIKLTKKIFLNKDIKNTITTILSICISLFVLTFNTPWGAIIGKAINTKFSIALGVLIIFLVCLLVYFVRLEDNYTSKPTNNKYKVFQYLVDIAIENKKKELN